MEKQIRTFAVKVLGMTDEEVEQSLYKKTDEGELSLVDDFDTILAKKDAERIARLNETNKQKLTEIHDKGYQKAQKEVLGKFEKDIKEKFGYDTDKTGIELVNDIVTSNKTSGKIEDVKTHPDYIKLERQLQSDFVPKTQFEEITGQFEDFKKNVERNNVIGKVKDDARKVFRSLNPILSKDPKKAANQESEFLSKLDTFDYQVQDDGNHVIIKDGGRLENDHKNPVGFSDFIKQKASELYDFADQPTKGNSGVGGSGSGSSGNFAFSNVEDFKKSYNKEFDLATRTKMYDAAKAQGLF